MTNNDIIRRLRYTFDFEDSKMIELFQSAGMDVKRSQISDWLKPDEHELFREIYDMELAVFLNGLINEKRGKRDGPLARPEEKLSNNQILRKLKIALNFKDNDMLSTLALADFKLSKHELSAFFRKPTQSQYRLAGDQVLRKFLYGLQIKYRDSVAWD